MAIAARKFATYEDLLALPASIKGEILDGVLYTQPRPRFRHARAQATLTGRIHPQYDLGMSDVAGGWWVLPEPGIELLGSIECSPDIAGWRRSRLPVPPPDFEPITIAPDWVCEILSPSTRDYDREVKMPFYAKHKVEFMWIVDPQARQILAFQRDKNQWREFGAWHDADRARIEPFVEVEINLSDCWA